MSLFQWIEEKWFQEFCDIYEEHAGEQSTAPEYADLMIGNYLTALLGSKNYEKAIEICMEEIAKNENRGNKPDRSSSNIYICCSIAKMELGQKDAMEILYAGRKANYQDLSRTELPCILYSEAILLGAEKGRRESIKLLKARLKNKGSSSPYFAIAQFITGGYTEEEMLRQISEFDSVLRERQTVKAQFYAAIKNFEEGHMKEYVEHLQKADALYDLCPAVVMEPEYHLTQICLSKAAGMDQNRKE